jgi:hypothetical protein
MIMKLAQLAAGAPPRPWSCGLPRAIQWSTGRPTAAQATKPPMTSVVFTLCRGEDLIDSASSDPAMLPHAQRGIATFLPGS